MDVFGVAAGVGFGGGGAFATAGEDFGPAVVLSMLGEDLFPVALVKIAVVSVHLRPEIIVNGISDALQLMESCFFLGGQLPVTFA